MAQGSSKKDIPMSKYPHLRRQYREYRRKKALRGETNVKSWEQWAKNKPEVKTISQKRKQRKKK